MSRTRKHPGMSLYPAVIAKARTMPPITTGTYADGDFAARSAPLFAWLRNEIGNDPALAVEFWGQVFTGLRNKGIIAFKDGAWVGQKPPDELE